MEVHQTMFDDNFFLFLVNRGKNKWLPQVHMTIYLFFNKEGEKWNMPPFNFRGNFPYGSLKS
jgi:hypothetical protein